MEENFAYTNTVDREFPKLDEKLINKICIDAQDMIVNNFRGFPVRLDPKLKANEWYICVSDEMLQLLEK